MDKPINVHGSALVLGTRGVLIRGKSGSGKSRLARQLIEHHLQIDSYASWVADDQVLLAVYKNAVIAKVPDKIAGQTERRFFGIDTVPFENATRLDLVVELVPVQDLERLPESRTVKLSDTSPSLPKIYAPTNDSALAADIILGVLQIRTD